MLRKVLNRFADHLALASGTARGRFDLRRGQIRVLTYHNVVPDHLADRPWVPSHAVSVSRFERQMAMLAELGTGVVRPLGEAIASRDAGAEPSGPIVCLTFDDGTADNLSLVLPVLQRYGFTATVFLTTGHLDSGELLANDIIRLLRVAADQGKLPRHISPVCGRLLAEPGFHKQVSVSTWRSELYDLWQRVRGHVDPEARQSLRPLTWDEARSLQAAGIELGAHTVNHVILSREDSETRRREIEGSITRVREELGLEQVPFAYPNGTADDYKACDLDTLVSIGVPYAVTQTPGWNDITTPRLKLRRNCIGLHGSARTFLAQVFGQRGEVEPSEMRRSA